MNYIERKKSLLTGKDHLEHLYTFKDFPVFMGCVDQPRSKDIKADMTWGICKDTGLIQLQKLLPLEILYLDQHNAGTRTSFQYHNKKTETNYIISGKAEVWLENDKGVVEKLRMKEGNFFNVVPPRKHRVIAVTDIILQEVSTPEVDDVVRLEDDAKRPDGRIESEHNK